MAVGTWAIRIAGDNETVQDLLDGVPGEMCPIIDKALGKTVNERHRYRSSLPREVRNDPTEDDYRVLRTEAEDIESRMSGGLEACRTALDALRKALVVACNRIIELESQLDQVDQ